MSDGAIDAKLASETKMVDAAVLDFANRLNELPPFLRCRAACWFLVNACLAQSDPEYAMEDMIGKVRDGMALARSEDNV